MPISIRMPALSPTMAYGTIARWLVKEGDNVASGDILVEIETDKATMEVEAVDEGIIGKILVPEGSEDIAINHVIALILQEGETPESLENFVSDENSQAENSKAANSRTAAPASADTEKTAPAPVKPAAPATDATANSTGRIIASPLAKRLAAEYGIDLRSVTGSAAHGRVVKADIEQAKQSGTASSSAGARQPAFVPTSHGYNPQGTLSPMPESEFVKASNIRKTIARRLSQSKQEIPHFYLTVQVDISQLATMRAQYNEVFENKSQKISINDLLIKASALALKDVPEANASWSGDGINYYHRADISVAVAAPTGLMTPIIRDAEHKPISLISAEMKSLAGRARDGKLKPEDYEGGTFTLSNMGMYGIDEFKAIINPPQACILAVGAARKTPIYNDENQLMAAMMLNLSLSVDHRVVDGAVAAQYCAALRKRVENPLWLFI